MARKEPVLFQDDFPVSRGSYIPQEGEQYDKLIDDATARYRKHRELNPDLGVVERVEVRADIKERNKMAQFDRRQMREQQRMLIQQQQFERRQSLATAKFGFQIFKFIFKMFK